jgi:hypothetical protein
MTSIKVSRIARAAALCVGAMVFAGAHAAGDKTAYDQVRASAKATYDADKKRCDTLSGNAEDICEAEAKAKRVRAEVEAEANWKGTAKARQSATEKIAKADYALAKERCDDMNGNAKDVCEKEAKAAQTRALADAKVAMKTGEARGEAAKDKRQADYKVAAEKCDAMSGDAKSNCITQAKKRYGM